jgi:hypothetical protein
MIIDPKAKRLLRNLGQNLNSLNRDGPDSFLRSLPFRSIGKRAVDSWANHMSTRCAEARLPISKEHRPEQAQVFGIAYRIRPPLAGATSWP